MRDLTLLSAIVLFVISACAPVDEPAGSAPGGQVQLAAQAQQSKTQVPFLLSTEVFFSLEDQAIKAENGKTADTLAQIATAFQQDPESAEVAENLINKSARAATKNEPFTPEFQIAQAVDPANSTKTVQILPDNQLPAGWEKDFIKVVYKNGPIVAIVPRNYQPDVQAAVKTYLENRTLKRLNGGDKAGLDMMLQLLAKELQKAKAKKSNGQNQTETGALADAPHSEGAPGSNGF
jgi:hypothetical protein